MHYRLHIDANSRLTGDLAHFTADLGGLTSLNDFSENDTVYFGVEWCVPIAASEVNSDYSADFAHPFALMLECTSIPQFNSYQSWDRGCSSVMTLLPSYNQSGYYGLTMDTPYLQSSALCGVTRGDVLAKRGVLTFRLLRSPNLASGEVSVFSPTSIEPYAFNLVFWTVRPEYPLTPYDHYHVWLNTGDRTRGLAQDCHIPLDITTFAMTTGKWRMAVSYISPVFHNIAVADLSSGLVLVSDTFKQEPSSNKNIVAYLDRSLSEDIVDNRYFGYRQSIKPCHKDTIGIPIVTPVDHKHEVHLKLLNATDLGAPNTPANVSDYVVCMTFYRY